MISDAEASRHAKNFAAAEKSARSRKRLRYASAIVFVAGLLGSALIYMFSPEVADGSALEIANRRSYEFQIERIGGKATVYIARFDEWLESLWHGRDLAYTIGVLALLIALGCLGAAEMVSTDEKEL